MKIEELEKLFEKSYGYNKTSIWNINGLTVDAKNIDDKVIEKLEKELNGYDGKDLIISEDMYIAYKIIMNGYKIKYCAESIVNHSHDFTLKEIYNRYYDTGIFFKQNSYLDKYGTNKSGGGLAIHIIKRAIQDKNIKVIRRFLPDMLVRFIGMKIGKIKGEVSYE